MPHLIASIIRRVEKTIQADIRYLVSGNFWLVTSRAVAVGAGIALSIFLANLLTPETFGFYKYVISLAGIVGAFSLTGLNTALINSIARHDLGILRTTFKEGVGWALVSSAITFAMSGYYFFQGNMPLGWALLIVALTYPISFATGNYRAIFSGLPDFRMGAIYGIPRSMVPIIIMIVVVLLTQNPLAVVAAYFIGNTLTNVILYNIAIRQYKVPATAESTKPTIRFARYTSALGFFSQFTSQIDQALVWHFVGPAGVAFYSFATSPIEQIQGFTGNIFSLVAPKFARKSQGELRASLPFRMTQMFLVVLPITILYILLAPFIFKLLFPQYLEAVFLSQIYALVLLLQPHGLVDSALIAKEDTGTRNLYIMAGQAMKLVFLCIGITIWGLEGGIIALIASELCNFILALIVLRYKM
ncbi:oligosaccharide flippase family protein [Patescibacteria group bacterium]|nr:oligosaccharide flippase family protein [Patescibacteria group bacterium]